MHAARTPKTGGREKCSFKLRDCKNAIRRSHLMFYERTSITECRQMHSQARQVHSFTLNRRSPILERNNIPNRQCIVIETREAPGVQTRGGHIPGRAYCLSCMWDSGHITETSGGKVRKSTYRQPGLFKDY